MFDGQPHPEVYIVTAPGQRTLIFPPNGWSLTGGLAGLACHPPDNRGGGIALRSTPFGAEPPAFDDPKGLEVYRRQALAEAPSGAMGVKIVEERLKPLNLTGWKTYEFVVAWELGGQFWQTSNIFVTLPSGDTMLGTATGLRADSPVLRDGLTRLLSSWCPQPAN